MLTCHLTCPCDMPAQTCLHYHYSKSKGWKEGRRRKEGRRNRKTFYPGGVCLVCCVWWGQGLGTVYLACIFPLPATPVPPDCLPCLYYHSLPGRSWSPCGGDMNIWENRTGAYKTGTYSSSPTSCLSLSLFSPLVSHLPGSALPGFSLVALEGGQGQAWKTGLCRQEGGAGPGDPTWCVTGQAPFTACPTPHLA